MNSSIQKMALKALGMGFLFSCILTLFHVLAGSTDFEFTLSRFLFRFVVFAALAFVWMVAEDCFQKRRKKKDDSGDGHTRD